MKRDLLSELGLELPILQAPMAGVSTVEMAAAVSNAGALGALGVGALDAKGARGVIEELRAHTSRAFNINLFVHSAPERDQAKEKAWLFAMSPVFAEFEAQPPEHLSEIYQSFLTDDAMFRVLLELEPPVVSFHFGLPAVDKIAALKRAGCVLLATATSVAEARMLVEAGIDGIVAQGFEAGGHRGVFDPGASDARAATLELTRDIVQIVDLPVIAAGGIMDGADIRRALNAGAVAAQLGTAFIGCPESSADAGYRHALAHADQTVMTAALSGRPARCLSNRFTDWAARQGQVSVPDYPVAYDAGKALNAAAKAHGDFGFGAQWAGTGAARARVLPAADLVKLLADELQG